MKRVYEEGDSNYIEQSEWQPLVPMLSAIDMLRMCLTSRKNLYYFKTQLSSIKKLVLYGIVQCEVWREPTDDTFHIERDGRKVPCKIQSFPIQYMHLDSLDRDGKEVESCITIGLKDFVEPNIYFSYKVDELTMILSSGDSSNGVYHEYKDDERLHYSCLFVCVVVCEPSLCDRKELLSLYETMAKK